MLFWHIVDAPGCLVLNISTLNDLYEAIHGTMQTLPDGPAQRDASDMLDYYANVRNLHLPYAQYTQWTNYYLSIQLIKAHPGVCVKRDSTGKGLYATTTFTQGARVLCEPPLCAIQHHENRAHALVCAACFRFLGSIEEQLAWQLMSLTSNLPPGVLLCVHVVYAVVCGVCIGVWCGTMKLHNQDSHQCSGSLLSQDTTHTHRPLPFKHTSRINTPHTRPTTLTHTSRIKTPHTHRSPRHTPQPLTRTSLAHTDHPDIAIMEGKAAALACQQTTLPHSASLNASLPSMVSCPGGCTTQVYCSIQCATRAWEEHHQLLCPGVMLCVTPRWCGVVLWMMLVVLWMMLVVVWFCGWCII